MNNFNQMVGNTAFTQRSALSPYFNPTQGASAPINNIVWVQGLEGAKSWQLPPNSTIILLDNEVEGKMYIKISDNIGMSSLRIFNFAEDVTPPANDNVTVNKDLDLSNLVTKDELSELIKEYLENNEQSVSTVAAKTSATKPNVIVTKQQSK